MQKTKSKSRVVLACILVIIWMAVIFVFSAMAGNDSASLSSGILHTILKIIPALSESSTAHLVIRKFAHMAEFGILCALLINLEYQLGFKIKVKQIIIAIICSFVYALTDEFHQTFINERSGNITDVGIDTSGAIITGLIA